MGTMGPFLDILLPLLLILFVDVDFGVYVAFAGHFDVQTPFAPEFRPVLLHLHLEGFHLPQMFLLDLLDPLLTAFISLLCLFPLLLSLHPFHFFVQLRSLLVPSLRNQRYSNLLQ
jgi:hypothetical protein